MSEFQADSNDAEEYVESIIVPVRVPQVDTPTRTLDTPKVNGRKRHLSVLSCSENGVQKQKGISMVFRQSSFFYCLEDSKKARRTINKGSSSK